PPAGNTPDAEPVDPERVADRGRVGRVVGDAAALLSRRAAVAGPVPGDEPDALLLGVADVRLVHQARPRRPVQNQDRHATRIARLAHAQSAPVRRLDRLHAATLATSK